MGIVEALNLCKSGWKVRPICWRTLNPDHWVEAIATPSSKESHIFVEKGGMEEMPHALRLSFPPEFLGEWETVE